MQKEVIQWFDKKFIPVILQIGDTGILTLFLLTDDLAIPILNAAGSFRLQFLPNIGHSFALSLLIITYAQWPKRESSLSWPTARQPPS